MRWTVPWAVLTVIGVSLFSLQTPTVHSQSQETVAADGPTLAELVPEIADRDYDEALAVFERHQAELKQMPGVEDVRLGPQGIVVFTTEPDGLPSDVEGLPIIHSHPLRISSVGDVPYKEARTVLRQHEEELLALPGVEEVRLGPGGLLVFTDNPDEVPDEVEGVPVQARHPMRPSTIGGLPYQEAREIYQQRRAELGQLPDVEDIRLGVDGILIFTDNPEALPEEMDGLPIEARTPIRRPRVGGLPYEEARAIFERNKEKLEKLPGVEEVGFSTKQGLILVTDTPATAPQKVEGLPVITVDPIKQVTQVSQANPPQQAQPLTQAPREELPPINGIPRDEARKIVERHKKELKQLPGVDAVILGEKSVLVYVTVHSETRELAPETLDESLAVLPAEIEGLPIEPRPVVTLPPPSGVILLQADGTQEEIDSCPEGFRQQVLYGWHLCFAPGFTDTIPSLWVPPIAGIPYEEALKILERHRDELMQLPGVNAVGMGGDGINVYTDQPELVPPDVEGLPIETLPPHPPADLASHTLTDPAVRPLRGALGIGDIKST